MLMQTGVLWIVMTVLYCLAMVAAELAVPDLFQVAWQASSGQAFNWVYSLISLVFGIFLLGTVTRVLHNASPTLWRPIMLCVGAGLTLVQRWIIEISGGAPMGVDMWLAAVLGLAVVAVLARVLPERLVLHWYGVKQ